MLLCFTKKIQKKTETSEDSKVYFSMYDSTMSDSVRLLTRLSHFTFKLFLSYQSRNEKNEA